MSVSNLSTSTSSSLTGRLRGLFRSKPSAHEHHRVLLPTKSITHQEWESLLDGGVDDEHDDEARLNARCNALLMMKDTTLDKRLESGTLEALWHTCSSLITQTTSSDVRETSVIVLANVFAKNAAQLRSPLRLAVVECAIEVNDALIFPLVMAVTESGRNAVGLERSLPKCVAQHMANVRKHPFSYQYEAISTAHSLMTSHGMECDPDDTASICQSLAYFIVDSGGVSSADTPTTSGSLGETIDGRAVVDSACALILVIVNHSEMPHSIVYQVLISLAYAMTVGEKTAQYAWQTTHALYASHFGNTCVHTFNCILQKHNIDKESQRMLANADNVKWARIYRGCVHLLCAGLWGAERCSHLCTLYSPSSILPHMHAALVDAHFEEELAKQVLQTCLRLMERFGANLHTATWRVTVTIIRAIVEQGVPLVSPDGDVVPLVGRCLDRMQQLYAERTYDGNQDDLFDLVQLCQHSRDVNSLTQLVKYRCISLHPYSTVGAAHAPKWQTRTLMFLKENVLAEDMSLALRSLSLDVLRGVIEERRHSHLTVIVRDVLCPFMHFMRPYSRSPNESNISLASQSITLALNVLPMLDDEEAFTSTLAFIKGVFVDELELCTSTSYSSWLECVSSVIDYAVTVFHTIFAQSHTGERVLLLMKEVMACMRAHYTHGRTEENGSEVRTKLWQLLLSLRVSVVTNHLCLYSFEDDKYLECRLLYLLPVYQGKDPAYQDDPSRIQWTEIAELLITAVKKEQSWSTLRSMVDWLPAFLNSPYLVESDPRSFEPLALALCHLPNEAPPDAPSPDHIICMMAPVWSSLLSHAHHMTKETSMEMMNLIVRAIPQDKSTGLLVVVQQCFLTHPRLVYLHHVLPVLRKLQSTALTGVALLELLSVMVQCDDGVRGELCNIALGYIQVENYTPFIVSHAIHVLQTHYMGASIYQKRLILNQVIEKLPKYEQAEYGAEVNSVLISFLRNHVDGERETILSDDWEGDYCTDRFVDGHSLLTVSTKATLRAAPTSENAAVEETVQPRRRHQSAKQPPSTRSQINTRFSFDDGALGQRPGRPQLHRALSVQAGLSTQTTAVPESKVVLGHHVRIIHRTALGKQVIEHYRPANVLPSELDTHDDVSDYYCASPSTSTASNTNSAPLPYTLPHAQSKDLPPSSIVSEWQGMKKVLSDKAEAMQRLERNIDRCQSKDTWTVGVLYMDQEGGDHLLQARAGSALYERLLAQLGDVTSTDERNVFTGGLEPGAFTYTKSTPLYQICYHIATHLPQTSLERKALIGNDHVLVVMNESGRQFRLGDVSEACTHVAVQLTRHDKGHVMVNVIAKPELCRWLALTTMVVSSADCGRAITSLVTRASLTARLWLSNEPKPPVNSAHQRYKILSKAARM